MTRELLYGFIAAESRSAGTAQTTAGEEAGHEDLDYRLARGLRDGVADERDGSNDGHGIGDTSDTDGEAWDDQVGEARARRLVAEDEGGPATTTRTRGPRRPPCTSSRTNEPIRGGQAGGAGEVG